MSRLLKRYASDPKDFTSSILLRAGVAVIRCRASPCRRRTTLELLLVMLRSDCASSTQMRAQRKPSPSDTSSSQP